MISNASGSTASVLIKRVSDGTLRTESKQAASRITAFSEASVLLKTQGVISDIETMMSDITIDMILIPAAIKKYSLSTKLPDIQ
jgi:hypothetical protein